MSGRYEQLSTTADEGTSSNLDGLENSSCHSGLSLHGDGSLPTRQVLSCIKITSRGLSSSVEKYKSCTVEDASALGPDPSEKQESKALQRLSNDFSIIENPVSDLNSPRYLKPDVQSCVQDSHNDEQKCPSQLKERTCKMHIIEGQGHRQTESASNLQCMNELKNKNSNVCLSPKVSTCISQADVLQSSTTECSPCSQSKPMAMHAPHSSIEASSTYFNTNEMNNISVPNCNQNKSLQGFDLNDAAPMHPTVYQDFSDPNNGLRSYTDEHANIQANLLAHFDSYSDYMFKPPTSESPLLRSNNGIGSSGNKLTLTSQQRSNSESSPCITDVDGNTSFKVGISNSNLGDKFRSSKKKNYGWRDSNSKSFDKAQQNSKSEMVPKSAGGHCEKARNVVPLVRSKSLSASKGSPEEIGGKLQRSSFTGSDGNVGSSAADDKSGFANFISRQLLSWRRQDSNGDAKSSDARSASTTTEPTVAKATLTTSKRNPVPQVQPAKTTAELSKMTNNISASLVRNPQVSSSRRSASYSMLKSEGLNNSSNSTPNSPRKNSPCENSLPGNQSVSSLSINSSPSREESAGNASSWWLLNKLGFRRNSKSSGAGQPQAGTAGLIMESRPAHLPAKSDQERLLHQQQHEQLLQQSRRKEQQLQEQQRRQHQMKLQQEAQMAEAVALWTDEILPEFAAKRDTKKCRELWWRGLPPSVRGKIWGLAIGNALNVSPHLYDLLQERSTADQQEQQLQKVANGASESCTVSTELQANHSCISDHREVAGWRRASPSQSFIPQYHIAPGHCEPAVVPPSPLVRCRLPEAVECMDCFHDPEDSGYSNASSSDTNCSLVGTSWFQVAQSVDCITLDVSRTFPQLGIFQQGGPCHESLHRLLQSYVRCRPDIGYVQGMSFLAATLLLNMPERDAFIAFANLLSKPLLQAFYSLHEKKMVAYYRTHSSLVAALLPALHAHLQKLQVTPDLYLLDWVLSLFTRSLPLDVASRIWDVFTRDGDEFFFRAACGVLKLYECELLALECTTTAAQFLTRLPPSTCQQQLFTAIARLPRPSGKRSFAALLAKHEADANTTSCV